MQYGCIGEHLTHSFSKIIHGELASYDYELREIPMGELDAFMTAREFKAINVTMPYKQEVIPRLKEVEPMAAAIGAGIDIAKPDGHMVVDIGGGTADIAVISLSGVVESASIKVAGDQFNEAIVKYMRRKHNILIGERTAELMKMQIGCVFPKEEEASIEIKGRCLMTGLPRTISVTSTEMMEAFEEPVERILEAIHGVLERTPPELVADISNNGIVMTGGGSLVDGFDKLIAARTGIHTMVAENAISCVAEGTGKSLDSLNAMQDGTVNLSRRRQMN